MQPADFNDLTIDRVLELAENALGEGCTNICRPLNSYINRVYELERRSGIPVIIKFYRPGRWDHAALQDEQDILFELAKSEIPVIPPLRNADGQSLHHQDGLHYSLFEKKGGRIIDEPNDEQWQELGRLLARMHNIGAEHPAENRIIMTPDEITRDQIEYILESDLIPLESRKAFESIAHELVDDIAPMFDDTELIRIHGDLHPQNIIYRPGESFFLIDFDDMAMGPPIQDLWMLLPGRWADAERECHNFLEGYEMFRNFDDHSIQLIEPLRAMRYLHFTAWCVCQAVAGGFNKLDADWGDDRYWKQEIFELKKQQTEIRGSQDGGMPMHFS
jgi:Ser/Thr protein kinase RdoA (MazF antagonist)